MTINWNNYRWFSRKWYWIKRCYWELLKIPKPVTLVRSD